MYFFIREYSCGTDSILVLLVVLTITARSCILGIQVAGFYTDQQPGHVKNVRYRNKDEEINRIPA